MGVVRKLLAMTTNNPLRTTILRILSALRATYAYSIRTVDVPAALLIRR
jgi:hypothetical protein